MTIHVLYISHTSTVGGGELSLLDLLLGLPDTVVPLVACPSGTLERSISAAGIATVEIPGTQASLRLDSGTPTALADLARSARALRVVARRRRIDLLHANSLRAGVAAALSRAGAPLVVTVRDCLPLSRGARLAQSFVGGRADVVVANSSYTAARFAAGGGGTARVVYPPIDLDRFDPSRYSRSLARVRLGVAEGTPLLGVVAQITPWKGQLEAIETLAAVRASVPDARLVLVGGVLFAAETTRFDNRAYEQLLRRAAADLGVIDGVSFLGERDDVPALLSALDLLLVPSWEEPFGRAAAEGLAMGVPVLATAVGGTAEVIEDGVDGLLLPPREPSSWARACVGLLRDPDRRAAFSGAGRRRVLDRFPRQRHVTATLDIYRGLVGDVAAQARPAEAITTAVGL